HLPVPEYWASTSVSLLPDGLTGWAEVCDVSVSRTEPFRGGRPAFYHTHDAGRTWAAEAVPGAPTCENLLIQAISRERAIIAASRTVFVTSNGGEKWVECGISDRFFGKPSKVTFTDQDHGWLGYQEGYLLRSSDAGRTWQVINQ